MNLSPNGASLADTIRNIYKQDIENAPVAIEAFLDQELKDHDNEKKQQILEDIISSFTASPALPPMPSHTDDHFLRFCSLLLGHPVEEIDLKTEALQQRLTEALTIIFETLNQLIRTINLTLLEDGQTEKTIRVLIGEQLDNNHETTSLKEHLDKIKTAFVTSHRAFKRAMETTVETILSELDPDSLAGKDEGGFKFNPLRKAESFNRYEKTYKECRQWFDSGRCMEDFLRNFEKQCAAMANPPRR